MTERESVRGIGIEEPDIIVEDLQGEDIEGVEVAIAVDAEEGVVDIGIKIPWNYYERKCP